MTFVGSLDAARTEKGVFITTVTFKRIAAAIPAKVVLRIILIDGKKPVSLMCKYNIAVFVTKKIRN
jgi:restriction endonuclease Mrr